MNVQQNLIFAWVLALQHCVFGGAIWASDHFDGFSVFGRALTRLQIAESDLLPRTTEGFTQSLQIAVEKRVSSQLTFLVEGEAVFAAVGKFNDGTGNNPDRLFIPDPNTLELNRLQLQYSFGGQSFLTLGRQTLAIDDQRFIGATPFRQNTQTFDALHFSKRFGDRATFQAGYFSRVNRVLGRNNVNGKFTSCRLPLAAASRE